MAGSNTKKLRPLKELEDEVRAGRCYLGSDSSSRVLRVVHVVTLRLIRDGLICAKVGHRSREQSTSIKLARAKLPGTKTQAGETPRKALNRLIKKEFEAIRPTVEDQPEVE